MDKNLVLAVAGSGKTYTIANSIDENKKNIIFTFNVQNVKNLKYEIKSRFGYIPNNTVVMTFHKFRYDLIVKPAQYYLGYELDGIEIIKIPPKRTNPQKGVYNRGYIKDSEIEHYIKDKKVYSEYLSKLIIKRRLVDKEYLEYFIDCIYIDEFQDFEDYDFKVIKELFNCNINFYAYGDYFQAGVSMNCNMKKIPYNKVDNHTKYVERIQQELEGIYIDRSSLSKTRRCGGQITNFINEKYGGEIIESHNINDTRLYFKSTSDIEQLKSEDVIFLTYNKKDKENYDLDNCKNWAISKGDTYENVCVILTASAKNFLNENKSIAPTTRNKLYVALTRATDKLYIIEGE